MEQRNENKHPSKVMDVEEADPAMMPRKKGRPRGKKLNYVDELEKAQPVAKRTRSYQPATRVLANMTMVPKKSIDLSDLFKYLVVAVPTVLCFILNAPVIMTPQKKRSFNGLEMLDEIPEFGRKETLGMTDAVCNMTKNDFEQLKYIQALGMVEEELDQDSDWDKSL